MSVSKIDLLNKRFNRAMRGYSPDEVDLVMHEAAEALGDLADENRRLKLRLDELEHEAARTAGPPGDELGGAVFAGRAIAREPAHKANRQAAQILDQAREEAKAILDEADRLKTAALEEATALKALEKTIHARLREFLEEHFRLLEAAEAADEEPVPHKDFIFAESQE